MKFIHYFLLHIVNAVIFEHHLSNENKYTAIEKRQEQITDSNIQSFVINKINNTQLMMNINKSFSYFDYEYYRKKRKVRGRKFNLWSKSIPFFIKRNLNRSLIVEALREIEKETCIRFHEVKRVSIRMTGIRYSPGSACSSYLGKRILRGFQSIYLAKRCETLGAIQHETLHILGIDHEHCRIDRDEYLFVLLKNVKRSDIPDFRVASSKHSNTFGLPYDYGSIMHYSMITFSKNNEPTLVPKHVLYSQTIGHVQKLSFIDIQTINMLYCKNNCGLKLNFQCFNGAYLNFNTCDRCRCVEGFVGKDCYYFTTNLPSCGKSIHFAHKFPQEIKVNGKIKCYYRLIAEKHAKIMLQVYTRIRPLKRRFCWPEDCLEIKYWEDKTVTGARFCGHTKNIFLSKSNVVIVYFRSTYIDNEFKLKFKKQ